MGIQKSAEAIVARLTTREGPNLGERRYARSLIGTDNHRRGKNLRTQRIGTESRRYADVWRDR